MTLYDFRRYPRRSIMSRRVADRRKTSYLFGTPEWVARLPNILRGLGMQTAWRRLQLRVSIVANWIIKREVNEYLLFWV